MTARSKGTPLPKPVTLGLTLSQDPLRAAFQRRSMEALNRISLNASPEILAEALAATTDVGALARALGDSGVVGSAVVELEPLAPLVARNAEHRLELLEAAGGALTASEVGALLMITRQAVDKRRRTAGLLGLRYGSDWRYPRCQFDEPSHAVIGGLPTLLKALPQTGPWAMLDFLLSPDETLGGQTPLETLRTHGWDDALERLARIEHGDGFS